MATNLFDPPPAYGIPLSRGGDIYLRFTLKVPEKDVSGKLTGNYVETDFPDGSTVTFAITTGKMEPLKDDAGQDVLGSDGKAIDGDVPVEVRQDAVISGSKATVLMDHFKLDSLSFDESQTWRVTYTSKEGIDSPIANGWTFRADGEQDDGF